MTDPAGLSDDVLTWLTTSTAVACARFSADGELRWANERFCGLVPSCAASGEFLWDMVVEGQRDDMRRLVAGERTGVSSSRVHVSAGGPPVTLLATWLWDGDELVLLGEAPVAELEASQAALAKLNQRATELARENAKKSAALQKALDDLQRQNEELQRARQHIEQLSREDALTGLLNRRWLEESLDVETERARRYGVPLSIVMMDVDRFKTINDRHGHLAGDEVLTATAVRVRGEARGTDLVGRYGGDEFLVVLPNTAAEQAALFAERIRRALAEMRLEFRPEPVTASLGVTQWKDGDTKTTFLARADEALYAAKASGRDKVEAR